MIQRIKSLEEKVSSISIDVAILKETIATKAELHKELNAQTWKIIAAFVIAMVLFCKYFIK